MNQGLIGNLTIYKSDGSFPLPIWEVDSPAAIQIMLHSVALCGPVYHEMIPIRMEANE